MVLVALVAVALVLASSEKNLFPSCAGFFSKRSVVSSEASGAKTRLTVLAIAWKLGSSRLNPTKSMCLVMSMVCTIPLKAARVSEYLREKSSEKDSIGEDERE
jgi:hypothetical protein